jgi:hypothetical protein
MAKISKAEAARQMGISRTTLYKLIHEGKVSVHPDGTIDTAELVRAVSTLSIPGHPRRTLDVHSVRHEHIAMDSILEGSEHHRRLEGVHSEQPRQVSTGRQFTDVVDTLMQTVDILRQELAIARERERAGQEREALLMSMLQEAHKRYDRLLEAPRAAQVPQDYRDRGNKVLAYMRQCEGPQTPLQVQIGLGWQHTPRYIMRRLAEKGVLRRVDVGLYELGETAEELNNGR